MDAISFLTLRSCVYAVVSLPFYNLRPYIYISFILLALSSFQVYFCILPFGDKVAYI